MTDSLPGTSVNIQDILDFLPHRYPFLLVDRVEEMQGEETAVGIKNVTYSEPWFTGHFPNVRYFRVCSLLRPLRKFPPFWLCKMPN